MAEGLWERIKGHFAMNWPTYALATAVIAGTAYLIYEKGGCNPENYRREHIRYLNQHHEMHLKLEQKKRESLKDFPVFPAPEKKV